MKNNKGFTLIELLVVIAIIGLLASVVLVSLNSARAKARDAKKISDFAQISKAIQLYYDKNNTVPPNLVNGNESCEFVTNTTQYVQTMQNFVSAGFLSSVPKSPGTQGYNRGYCYFDYGPNNNIGVLLVTQLESATPSTTGLSPSCRPWASGTNWCDQSINNYYCLCVPY